MVEFTLAVEESFGYRFPATETLALETPGKLIDYLTRHLPAGQAHFCLSQRAFYLLRRNLLPLLSLPRSAVRPCASLLALLPEDGREQTWQAVRAAFGTEREKWWPKIAKPGWFYDRRHPRLTQVKEVCAFMVARLPHLLKDDSMGWTRGQVAEVVHGLIREELSIGRHEYTESSHWKLDMGVD